MAKYKIHQASYINDKPYDEGATITVSDEQKPGPHWEPLDDAAKAAGVKHGIAFTGEVPDCMDAMTAELDRKKAEADAKGNPTAIGNAVVDALVDHGVIDSKKKGGKKAAASDEV